MQVSTELQRHVCAIFFNHLFNWLILIKNPLKFQMILTSYENKLF